MDFDDNDIMYEVDSRPVSDSMEIEIPTVTTSSIICPEEAGDIWLSKLASNSLNVTHFKEYWRQHVLDIYAPLRNCNCLQLSYDDVKAQKYLYDPLARFICQGEPLDVLKFLKANDVPPALCGRVFKLGEPTYTCRDCAMDPTCVLCVTCFQQSSHGNHRYKMNTSYGGGYCDCGDVEAWKGSPYCAGHLSSANRTSENALDRLPPDIVERARAVFFGILLYSYQLLSVELTELPSDLKLKPSERPQLDLDEEDTFCTVLYNDESHTFELVISMLIRAIDCTQKEAMEYATNIDREGRSLIRCSSLLGCIQAKNVIERQTSRHGSKPLKVLVIPVAVYAHQLFAMKLLVWLQKMLEWTEGFRALFCQVIFQEKVNDVSLLEGLFLCDTKMWKTARTHWHRLFIAGLLMEYDNKKEFAKLLTHKYPDMMKDFIYDDHDHSFSVTSLSVQVYTVTSIAHWLIEDEDAIAIILTTLLSECERKKNTAGRFEFERNNSNSPIRRAHFLTYDLKYLLSNIPTEWNNKMRHGILHGYSILVKILASMQGMDSVVRQVGQHMEFEPEWETAFTLHIRLACAISLLLEWFSTDKAAFIKAYRLCIMTLHELLTPDMTKAPVVRELVDHSASCIAYDVSTQPVSLHLPVSRLFAGLYLVLESLGMSFDSADFSGIPKPTPQQIMEPVIRTQVLISQVHAGMWRRNGYSLLNQLYFYHNVKCRNEMQDRDIVLLQISASLIESNEFLIHLLYRYGLMSWAEKDFETISLKAGEEDSMRQIIALIEEFFRLIITIITERYIPGVGKNVTRDEQLKNEIIHMLCVEPMAHSTLMKSLPEDSNHETGMERVIGEVAEFVKPKQPGTKGVYELKKEMAVYYNVFFYHYTREEQSKAEETQRKRRKEQNLTQCSPPPPLPAFCPPFRMVTNLMQCDIMLHLFSIVLSRAANLRARSFSEPQFQRVLHLISCALAEELRVKLDGDVESIFKFTQRASKWGLLGLLESLVGSQRIEAHQELLDVTIKEWQHLIGAIDKIRDKVAVEKETESAIETMKEEEQKLKHKIAEERRAKVMAQMAAMQKNFMKKNTKLFESANVDVSGESSEPSTQQMEVVEQLEVGKPVAIGPNQTYLPLPDPSYTCILCQEDEKIDLHGRTLVLAAFVQKSTILCKSDRSLLLENTKWDPLFLKSDMATSAHTSTCGHVMHSVCWQKYFDSVLSKERKRPYRMRQPLSFDIEKQEYLCPLCECLSNTVLPLVPHLKSLPTCPLLSQSTAPFLLSIPFSTWIEGLHIALKYTKQLEETPLPMKAKPTTITEDDGISTLSPIVSPPTPPPASPTIATPPQPRLYYTCPSAQVAAELQTEEWNTLFPTFKLTLPNELNEMLGVFAQATYTNGLGVNPHANDERVPLMLWHSCAYTIHGTEWMLREEGKPLFGQLATRQVDCFTHLIRVAATVGLHGQPQLLGSHALRLLCMLLKPSDVCVMEWDPLGVLIPLVLALPSLFCSDTPAALPLGKLQELNVLKLVYLSHLVQISLQMENPMLYDWMDTDEGNDTKYQSLVSFTNHVREAAQLQPINTDKEAHWQQVTVASLPFLRCAALFFHFVTGVNPPNEMKEVGGDTYTTLCNYLSLDLTELITDATCLEISTNWAGLYTNWLRNSGAPVLYPLGVNQLVSLPEDYSDLVNQVAMFTCPNSDGEDSRTPTMCLICGKVFCSQSYCCQEELGSMLVGACTYHVNFCGAGVGVFLRVRECKIIFMAGKTKGCYVSPPYLDKYGETDQGLRRGNPLYMNEDRYRQINRLWLGHRIPEEIAHSVEASTSVVATEWFHL